VTLDHPDITRHLVFVYEPRKLSVRTVISAQSTW
jgi:hypothetical protein